MKCEYCHGAGKIKTIKLISAEQGFDCVEEVCTKCNGSGEVVQTNEEWFCQLSTEEKAEWLSKHLHCGDCNIENRECFGTYSGCKETLIKWLREKHE